MCVCVEEEKRESPTESGIARASREATAAAAAKHANRSVEEGEQ